MLCRWADDHDGRQASSAEVAQADCLAEERKQPSQDAADHKLPQPSHASQAENGTNLVPAAHEASATRTTQSAIDGELANSQTGVISRRESTDNLLHNGSECIQLPLLPAEAPTTNILDKELQQRLWRKKYDFTAADRYARGDVL